MKIILDKLLNGNHFAFNIKGNSKTDCPTTTSTKATCPDSCPLKTKGCYFKYSFMGAFWNKLTNGTAKGGMTYDAMLKSIEELPDGSIWRHNQGGDLVKLSGSKISASALNKLIKANEGKNGFTYTHHKLTQYNQGVIWASNQSKFTINLSSNNLEQADDYLALGIAPVVTLLAMDAPKVSYTPANNKVVACPAEKDKGITCRTCKLCAIKDRDYIIGFRAHGTGKKAVELIATDGGNA